MLKEEEIYPPDTVVRIKKTGQFAIIKDLTYQSGNYGFLYYRGIIEGRGDGLYCLIHQEIELECLPGKAVIFGYTMKDRIQQLIEEYLKTLNDSDCNELYNTDREFAEIGLGGFIEWLNAPEQSNLDPYDLERNK